MMKYIYIYIWIYPHIPIWYVAVDATEHDKGPIDVTAHRQLYVVCRRLHAIDQEHTKELKSLCKNLSLMNACERERTDEKMTLKPTERNIGTNEQTYTNFQPGM